MRVRFVAFIAGWLAGWAGVLSVGAAAALGQVHLLVYLGERQIRGEAERRAKPRNPGKKSVRMA